MEFTEISTDEFSSMFANGAGFGAFEGEEGFKEEVDNKIKNETGVSDLTFPTEYDDEGKEFTYDPDLDNEEDEDVDDIDDQMVDQEVEEFEDDKLYQIGEEKYEVGQIEKAVAAYKDISSFQSAVQEHQRGLEQAEEEFNKLQSLAYGQIDATMEYYQNVMDDPRTNDTDYRMALREYRNAEAKKTEIEQQYAKSREVMAQRKREAEALKANTVKNELIHNHNWSNDDLQMVGNYIIQNKLQIRGDAVNTPLMIALRKAAEFDSKKNKVEQEADQKVVKALRSKGVTKASTPPQNTTGDAAKRKAKVKAERGELPYAEMFDHLVD